ncbi:MAG TPA: NERD domain-containing protein [Conexibacter sp.]|nr:NERD domain-containing protein [Conexibacter sp.]
MRMLPSIITSTTRSAAERKLFRLLQTTDLGPHAVALHSLGIPDHIAKPMGEADFVVVCPGGLLVIEVKGGRLRRDSDGVWYQLDRHGRSHRSSEGPFVQAQTAMWSIREGLLKRLGKGSLGQLAIGYAVALPDVDYEEADCLEAPAELVLDRARLHDGATLQHGLERLLTLWRRKVAKRDPADARIVAAVTRELRRSFDLAVPLAVRSESLVAHLETLTDEQYAGLDWIQDHPRLLVGGGAGTGKTMLAVETARRDALAGHRILFTCRSHVLAAFVGSRDLPRGVEVMPIEVAVEAVEAGLKPFDCVIVDEAQDIFTVEGVDALEVLLRGGLDEGRWRCFFDVNNQAGFYGLLEEAVLELLQEAASGPTITLRRNCRNPRPVVVETRAVTGADLGMPLDGAGPKVSFAFPASDEEEAQLLAAELGRLRGGEIAAGSITILSPRPFARSPVHLLPRSVRDHLRVVDTSNVGAWPPSATTFAQIDDFKGLENDFVLVCGLERLTDAVVDRARLYVAMSRPRYGLWIAIPERLRPEFRRLKTRHIQAIIGATP